MKLKTRLGIAFLIITILPLVLSVTVIFTFSRLQLRTIEENYGITGATYEYFTNPTKVLNNVKENANSDVLLLN